MAKLKIALFLFLLGSLGCLKERFDMLTLERKNFNGNEIRTDGYYYAFSKTSTGESLGTIFFLYKNGVFFYLGSPKVSTVADLEAYTRPYIANPNGGRRNWGVFQVEGSQISIERWLYNSGGKIPAQVFQGQILNDTTFRMELFSTIETWKFRPFAPKPDSTNAYVK